MRRTTCAVSIVALFIVGVRVGEAATEHLWTYPAPGQDEYKSEHYTAEVAQGCNSKEVFVYRTLCPWHHYYKDPYYDDYYFGDHYYYGE